MKRLRYVGAHAATPLNGVRVRFTRVNARVGIAQSGRALIGDPILWASRFTSTPTRLPQGASLLSALPRCASHERVTVSPLGSSRKRDPQTSRRRHRKCRQSRDPRSAYRLTAHLREIGKEGAQATPTRGSLYQLKPHRRARGHAAPGRSRIRACCCRMFTNLNRTIGLSVLAVRLR